MDDGALKQVAAEFRERRRRQLSASWRVLTGLGMLQLAAGALVLIFLFRRDPQVWGIVGGILVGDSFVLGAVGYVVRERFQSFLDEREDDRALLEAALAELRKAQQGTRIVAVMSTILAVLGLVGLVFLWTRPESKSDWIGAAVSCVTFSALAIFVPWQRRRTEAEIGRISAVL